jgi:hypothetical protein
LSAWIVRNETLRISLIKARNATWSNIALLSFLWKIKGNLFIVIWGRTRCVVYLIYFCWNFYDALGKFVSIFFSIKVVCIPWVRHNMSAKKSLFLFPSNKVYCRNLWLMYESKYKMKMKMKKKTHKKAQHFWFACRQQREWFFFSVNSKFTLLRTTEIRKNFT